jgi:Domain of unknown function (DUF4386)
MLLALFFNLAAIIIEAVTTMNLLDKSHSYGFGVSLLFFGCFCVIVGYLIFRSSYLPKTIGVLMQIAGVSYLTNSFALVLSPLIANRLFPVILVPAFYRGGITLPLASCERREHREVA